MTDNQKEAFETFDLDQQPIRGFPSLRWAGKRPFASARYYPAQRKETYGDPVDGWWNRLYWGDNLQVMSHLLRDFRGKVGFVYIDPPFDSKADYKKSVELRGKTASNSRSTFEEKQYGDIWQSDQYLQFMFERLTLIKALLSNDGVVALHCDYHQNHHLRCICEEIFGPENFINEIKWKRAGTVKGNTGQGSKNLGENVDTILLFGGGGDYPFEMQYTDYSQEYISNFYKFKEADGRVYRLVSMTAPGADTKGNPQYEVMGVTRYWRYSQAKMEKLIEDGLVVQTKPGNVPQKKLYLDDGKGVPIQTLWTDMAGLAAVSSERVGYPTQKPEELLERLIRLFTEQDTLVFDSFMGSGTTQAVAMKLGRRFIGADINLGAIETTVKRLNDLRHEVESNSGDLLSDDSEEQNGIRYTGFELYNVNNYDIFRNPVEAKELVKEAMELQPLPTNSVFDGQRDQHLVKIMPVNRIATRADLNEVINGLDFKAYERRQAEAPSKIVDRIMLVCMGHEPDIGPELVKAAKPFNIEVEVVDLIRDKANLHFKRQSDAKLVIKDGHLEIGGFYPLNLLQKLSMETDAVEDWRQLVETIKVDWNYDGAVLSPELIDAPDKNELVTGRYPIPDDASTIRVKITDLLSESWEGEIEHG